MKFKKIFILLLVTASLLSLLPLSISARDADMTVSEDYSTVTYGGNEYMLVGDTSDFFVETDNYTTDIALSDSQSENISSIEAFTSYDFVELYIEYALGGYASYLYVREDIIAEFKAFESGRGEDYEIELYHGNVNASPEELFGKPVTIKGYELRYYAVYDSVYKHGLDGTIKTNPPCGYLFSDGEGRVYYFDYDLSPSEPDLSPALNETLTVWEIIDEDLLDLIREKSDSNVYDDDYYDDYYEDDAESAVAFSVIMIALFMVLVPLGGAVACFIVSFFARKPYKVYLRIAAGLLAASAFISILLIILILISV